MSVFRAMREDRAPSLDPVCDSGNFLHIAYREMKRLEARLNERVNEVPRRAEPEQRHREELATFEAQPRERQERHKATGKKPRGLFKARAEWTLVTLAYNLQRLYHMGADLAPA